MSTNPSSVASSAPRLSLHEGQNDPTQPGLASRPSSILPTILDHIGHTPLIRINNIGKEEGRECEIVAKCEYFNPGGSVKDRICKRMIEDAEKAGRIKPGATLIEATSGNTGIGLALVGAVKGYRVVIAAPDKTSPEKVDILEALGAEVVLTPSDAPYCSDASNFGVSRRLNAEIKHSYIPDQFANPSNPQMHYETTAEELLEQCDGHIDMVVMGAGTGGTLSGVARKLKERLPHVKIVGVDPIGSIYAQPESLNAVHSSGYQVEGIGGQFIPKTLDRKLVDEWIKVNDTAAFRMSRRLIREEGILCGGSAGAAMTVALQASKTLKAGQRCVVLFPDIIRNYMSEILNDAWMVANGHMVESELPESVKDWWWRYTVGQLGLATPVTVAPDVTCEDAILLLSTYAQLPVVDSNAKILGVVTAAHLMKQLLSKHVQPSDPVSKALFKQFHQVELSCSLGRLSQIFDKDRFALVVATQNRVSSKNHDDISEQKVLLGVVTRIDLLKFIQNGP